MLIKEMTDKILDEYNTIHNPDGTFGDSGNSFASESVAIDKAIDIEVEKILPKPKLSKGMTKAQTEKQREVWRIRKQLQRALSLQNKRCSVCGNAHTLERHHVDGNIRNNSLKNITVLCEKDHIEVHNVMGVGRYEKLKKSTRHNVKEIHTREEEILLEEKGHDYDTY
jgi:hypothetical protein